MDDCEEPEATGATKRVATFDIDVTFAPRTIDPDTISERLGLRTVGNCLTPDD